MKRIGIAFASILALTTGARAQVPAFNTIAKGVAVAIDRSGPYPHRLAALRGQLATGSTKQRVNAMSGLVAFGDFDLYPTLLKMITDRDEGVRLPAAYAIQSLLRRESIACYVAFRDNPEKREAIEAKSLWTQWDIASFICSGPEKACELFNGVGNKRMTAALLEETLGEGWTKPEPEPEEKPTQAELDCLPFRCGTYDHGPETIRRLISKQSPDLYLDYVERADGYGKRTLVDNYRGEWSSRAEEVMSKIAANPADAATEEAMGFLGAHPSPSSIRILNARRNDPRATVRLHIFSALSDCDPNAAWLIATEMICDRSADLRRVIAEELVQHKDARTEGWARRELSSSVAFRSQGAIDVLVTMQSDKAYEILASYILQPKSVHRVYAAEMLCYSSSPVVQSLFIKLAYDQDPEILYVYCNYASNRGDVSDIPNLRQLMKHPDESVQESAKDAIKRILDKAK